MKPRNNIKRAIAAQDPTRLRSRTVEPEKGKGRKRRPRQKAVEGDESEGETSRAWLVLDEDGMRIEFEDDGK